MPKKPKKEEKSNLVTEEKARKIGRQALQKIENLVNDQNPRLPLGIIPGRNCIQLIFEKNKEKIVLATFSWEESLFIDISQTRVDEFE